MASCVIAGSSFDVLVDAGVGSFVLDRDHMNTLGEDALQDTSDVMTSLGDLALSASWRWGATAPRGPLTEPNAGTGAVTFLDTLRQFDPANADSPSVDYLRPGLLVVIMAGGGEVHSGILERWSHDLGAETSTLQYTDWVGAAGKEVLPVSAIAAGSTAEQAAALFALSPSGLAAAYYNGSAFWHGAWSTEDGMTLLGALKVVRLSELGALVYDRIDLLHWIGTDTPWVPLTGPSVINCGGVYLETLETSKNEERVRNVVRIKDNVPEEFRDPASYAQWGERTFSTSVAELGMGSGLYPAAWAAALLADTAGASILWQLGTMRPTDAEITPIVGARWGDQWEVVDDETVPIIDRLVSVVGLAVTVTPAGYEVDAITEDKGDAP